MREGVCDRCGPKKRAKDENRGSAAERGYDWTWQKFAENYRAEHPLCLDCLDRGLVKPMTDIHHKQRLRDRPDLKFDEDNLMPLCHDCHSVRTARGE